MKKIYKWKEWLARPGITLLRGVHYNCSQSAMCQMIRNAASKRGVRVRLSECQDKIIIEVTGDTRRELPISSNPPSTTTGLENCTFPQGTDI